MGRESGTGKKEGLNVRRARAEIDLREIPEAVNGQASAGEQRKRERELADHKHAAQTLTARARAGTAAFLQSLSRIDACGIPCRRAAKQQTRQRGGRKREQQDREG